MSFDKGIILEAIQNTPYYKALAEAYDVLRKPADGGGFDWKFWDSDDDKIQGPFAEFKNNVDLITQFIEAVVLAVEGGLKEALDLQTSEEKLEAAAILVADAWKWPKWLFWAGSLKGMIVKLMISQAVGALNKHVGSDWGKKLSLGA